MHLVALDVLSTLKDERWIVVRTPCKVSSATSPCQEHSIPQRASRTGKPPRTASKTGATATEDQCSRSLSFANGYPLMLTQEGKKYIERKITRSGTALLSDPSQSSSRGEQHELHVRILRGHPHSSSPSTRDICMRRSSCKLLGPRKESCCQSVLR